MNSKGSRRLPVVLAHRPAHPCRLIPIFLDSAIKRKPLILGLLLDQLRGHPPLLFMVLNTTVAKARERLRRSKCLRTVTLMRIQVFQTGIGLIGLILLLILIDPVPHVFLDLAYVSICFCVYLARILSSSHSLLLSGIHVFCCEIYFLASFAPGHLFISKKTI